MGVLDAVADVRKKEYGELYRGQVYTILIISEHQSIVQQHI
jgi:hypothetical protein